MKKILSFLMCVSFLLFTSCNKSVAQKNKACSLTQNKNINYTNEEMRGVWLSFFEISDMCKEKTEAEYRKNAEQVIENVSNAKLNTIFYQVRAFSDALYKSEVFPTSQYIAEKEGGEILYDPLAIFIELATKYNISVHAWVNPFRVSYSTDLSKKSYENPARILFEKNKNTNALIFCESGVFYNPSDENAKKIIFDGIRELLINYDIKGIQLDDYFYPEAEFSNDKEAFEIYKKSGGALSLENWRKENVSCFISSLYSLIKGYDEAITFGVSPSADFNKNEAIYADVKLWCEVEGFIDYIMPQIYYGFKNEKMPFVRVAEEWASLKRCKGVRLYCGFSVYKYEAIDEFAGTGKAEWLEETDILTSEYKLIKNNSAFSGFALYSYSYCFGAKATAKAKKDLLVLTSVL